MLPSQPEKTWDYTGSPQVAHHGSECSRPEVRSLIEVEDVYQLLLGNADLVRERVVIGKPTLHQVALPIFIPQR